MKNQRDAPVGSTVYLAPHTRLAPFAALQRSPATVLDYDWPMVKVSVRMGRDSNATITVHADNINLHPPKAGKGAGDSAGATEKKTRRGGKKHKPLALPEGWEEQTLF